MSYIKTLTALFIFLLFSYPALADVPTIGDNSILRCEIVEDEDGCYGSIYWPASNKYIRLRRARTLLDRLRKRYRIQRRQAFRKGESAAVENFSLLINNINSSLGGARNCWFYESDSCSGGGGNPTLACQITADPANSRSRSDIHPRIVNGAICSSAAQSPVVAIRYFNQQYCTGSLVAPSIVITAAHCLEGVDCTDMTVSAAGGTSRAVASCISHPSWTGFGDITNNDVALLFLSGNLAGVKLVKLYTSNDFQVGEQVVMAGYGRNEVDDENLRAVFNVVSSFSSERISTKYNRGQGDRGTTCNGDSGGPLFVLRNNQWQLVGATSNGSADNCALPGKESSDVSNWANLTSASNKAFIGQHTNCIVNSC
jgi:hypothetical protein